MVTWPLQIWVPEKKMYKMLNVFFLVCEIQLGLLYYMHASYGGELFYPQIWRIIWCNLPHVLLRNNLNAGDI